MAGAVSRMLTVVKDARRGLELAVGAQDTRVEIERRVVLVCMRRSICMDMAIMVIEEWGMWRRD
jgi:hypothetical protein